MSKLFSLEKSSITVPYQSKLTQGGQMNTANSSERALSKMMHDYRNYNSGQSSGGVGGLKLNLGERS